MRYILVLLIFLPIVSFSQSKGKNTNGISTPQPLSETDQRKFDFFLYEGARQKMLNNVDNAIADYAQCYSINKYSPVVLYELARLMKTKISDNISFMETAVSLEPTNTFYLNYLANLYFQVGLNQKGITTYERIYAVNPEDDEFTFTLARTAGYFGDIKTSMKYFDLLESRMGINYSVSQSRIQVYEKASLKKEAIKEHKKLIKAFPNDPQMEAALGRFYMTNNMSKEAIILFTKLSQNESTSGESYLSLALLNLAKGDSLLALSQFRQGLLDKNLSSDLKMVYIKSLITDKSTYVINLMGDRTEEFIKTVISVDPHCIDAFLYLGFYSETDKNDKAAAISYYLQATSIDPTSYDAWKFLLSSFGSQNRFEDIVKYGKEAVSNFPDDPTLLYYYGIANSITQNDSIAIISFEKSLNSLVESNADNSTLYVGIYASLGDLYYRTDSTKKAFDAYEQVLKIDPSNISVLNNYAYYLSEQNLDLDKAETMSSKVIQLEPGNPTFLDTYAWVLFKLKRYSESKFIIERAIDKMTELNDVIVEHYGDILYFNSLKEEALVQWKKARDLGSKSPKIDEKISTGIYIE